MYTYIKNKLKVLHIIKYGGILLPITFKIHYVNLQHNNAIKT